MDSIVRMLMAELDRCDFSLPLATWRPGHVGNKENHEQYQGHERCRAIFRQIMRNNCRNPGECESGVGPLFQSRNAGNDERDTAEQFGDPKEDAQLLRISDMRESLDSL